MKLSSKCVLVIGWEYPPKMVGGLSIATHGIVKSLSKFIHVKLIIPYKNKNTPIDENVTVYGLNSINADLAYLDIEKLKNIFCFKSQTQNISVYPSTYKKKHFKLDKNEVIKDSKDYLNLFKSEEVYGWNLWERMKAFKEVIGIISEHMSFDIIHCHDWITFEAGCLVKQKTNKPLALHVHALETDRIGSSVKNEIYYIELNAMQYADVIFPVSDYTKKCIVENYSISKNKIIPIHNAIEKEAILRWRHKIPQKIVTFLGRLTFQKGPEFLFETIRKVISEYKNVRFVIAGSGDLLEELVMTGAYEQLSKYMIFTGFIDREDVNTLLATSDIYFMPSVSEPFGLTALEAARAGVSCVITKQSGAAEVLFSALKADFWDTDKFAMQIIELLKDDTKRLNISIEQKKEISRVSWNTSAEKIVSEYYKLLN